MVLFVAFEFLIKTKMKPFRTNVLEGKKLRGEAVKPWSLVAKTDCYRTKECLYDEVRHAFQQGCGESSDVRPIGIEPICGE